MEKQFATEIHLSKIHGLEDDPFLFMFRPVSGSKLRSFQGIFVTQKWCPGKETNTFINSSLAHRLHVWYICLHLVVGDF